MLFGFHLLLPPDQPIGPRKSLNWEPIPWFKTTDSSTFLILEDLREIDTLSAQVELHLCSQKAYPQIRLQSRCSLMKKMTTLCAVAGPTKIKSKYQYTQASMARIVILLNYTSSSICHAQVLRTSQHFCDFPFGQTFSTITYLRIIQISLKFMHKVIAHSLARVKDITNLM